MMYIIIFKLCIVFSIVSPSLQAQNNYRKYNVDQESFKLYGEDFKSVLKKFRRTPDYLKILQDKLGDLKTSAKEMSLQVLHYYHGKLEERVNEALPTTTTVSAPAHVEKEEPQPQEKLNFHAYGNRRQDEPGTDPGEDSFMKINNLDNYKVFDSKLSVAERNSLKDMGFEFAGKIIHSIIDNMSPNPSSGTTEKFTHVPEGGQYEEKEEDTTTTIHPSEHAGTTHTEEFQSTVHEEESPATEQFR